MKKGPSEKTLERWDAVAVSFGHADLKTMLETEFLAGFNSFDIAEKLHLSRGRVLELAKFLDVPLSLKHADSMTGFPLQLQRLVDREGLDLIVRMTPKQIADILHCHHVTARRYLRISRELILKQAKEQGHGTTKKQA